MIPGIGYTDDAMAVAFCIKMIHDDLEKYKTILSWSEPVDCSSGFIYNIRE